MGKINLLKCVRPAHSIKFPRFSSSNIRILIVSIRFKRAVASIRRGITVLGVDFQITLDLRRNCSYKAHLWLEWSSTGCTLAMDMFEATEKLRKDFYLTIPLLLFIFFI